MHRPEAYISELKQPFNQLCHFTKVHLRPATELQLLQRPRTLANTKEQLTLPLRVQGFFLKIDNLFCFQNELSRVPLCM